MVPVVDGVTAAAVESEMTSEQVGRWLAVAGTIAGMVPPGA